MKVADGTKRSRFFPAPQILPRKRTEWKSNWCCTFWAATTSQKKARLLPEHLGRRVDWTANGSRAADKMRRSIVRSFSGGPLWKWFQHNRLLAGKCCLPVYTYTNNCAAHRTWQCAGCCLFGLWICRQAISGTAVSSLLATIAFEYVWRQTTIRKEKVKWAPVWNNCRHNKIHPINVECTWAWCSAHFSYLQAVAK